MDCPTNESIRKKRADRYKCQNKDIYQCLLIKDKTRLKGKKFALSRLESVKVSKAMYYTY